ncbi:hypothetical protein CAL7716_101640 (plasmid) [Calothrix sp. PCC 7716]|nr:hypothetical protein CAL7716_101640 [Calothrix sp. PCC 7716]
MSNNQKEQSSAKTETKQEKTNSENQRKGAPEHPKATESSMRTQTRNDSAD